MVRFAFVTWSSVEVGENPARRFLPAVVGRVGGAGRTLFLVQFKQITKAILLGFPYLHYGQFADEVSWSASTSF